MSAPTKATPLNDAVRDVASTVSAGEVPTNNQINNVLDEANELLARKKTEAPLNAKGVQIAEQMQNVLASAQHLINEKNEGDSLQKIASEAKGAMGDLQNSAAIKQAKEASTGVTERAACATKEAGTQLKEAAKEAGAQLKEAGAQLKGAAKDAAKDAGVELAKSGAPLAEQGKQAAQAVASAAMDLARELITSPELRSLLVDLISLAQQALGETAQKLQEGAQKMQEGVEKANEQLEEVKGKVQSESGEQLLGEAQAKAGELKEQAQQKAGELKEQAQQKVGEIKEQAQQKAGEIKEKVGEVTEKAQAKAGELKEQAQQKFGEIKEQAQQKVGELTEKAKQTANDVMEGRAKPEDLLPISEERKREIRDNINALISRIASNPSYRRAYDSLSTLFSEYQSILSDAKTALQQTAETAQSELKQNEHIQAMWAEARTFLGRWTGGRSLEPFFSHLSYVYQSIANDPELTSWWSDLRAYINEALENPRAAIAERNARFDELISRARSFRAKIQYDSNVRGLLAELRVLLESVRDDAALNDLINNVRTLVRTLFFDTRGQPALKPEELRQFKLLAASLVMEELKYIPVPRIEGSTDKYDFCLNNISFYGFDLLPEHVILQLENRLDFNTKDIKADEARSIFTFKLTNMHCTMKNVMFWFRKKTGLIQVEDSGTADVSLAGRGASLTVRLELDQNAEVGLRVRDIKCDLDKLNIHIVDSKYDWLLNLLEPIMANDIKRSIEREVERRFRNTLNRVFGDLRRAMPDTTALKDAGDVIKSELKDLQATKARLEVDHRAPPS